MDAGDKYLVLVKFQKAFRIISTIHQRNPITISEFTARLILSKHSMFNQNKTFYSAGISENYKIICVMIRYGKSIISYLYFINMVVIKNPLAMQAGNNTLWRK